jgi:hypothetical protein
VTIILSVVAALSGLMIVGPLASYQLSERIVRRALSSRNTLLEFWSLNFKELGGVMATLLSENPYWPKPKDWNCRIVISVEYQTYRRLRRHAIIASVLLTGAWCWASSRFSFWILSCFVSAVLVGAFVNRERNARESLINIFRAVRLWLWVNPESLDLESEALQVTNVVELLRTVEPSMPRSETYENLIL